VNDHLPPITVEVYRHFDRVDRIAEKAHVEKMVAERDGEPVGTIVLEKMWWAERAGGFFGRVVVEPELWGQGIGSRMFDWVLARLKELGAERLYGNVRNDRPAALDFLAHRGFHTTGHADRWSRLRVSEANLAGYEGVEARLASEGLAIKTLAEVGESEALLRKLHAANDEAVRDIPMSEAFTATPFEMFLEELRDPQLSPERIWIAMDGEEPAGLVILPVQADGSAFNGFTGVVRKHRGKGVARALKLKSVEWCRDHGVEYIYTANDVNNQRMLSINNSLGYQELPISDEYVRELD
jgi:GNAT superfamily N-acetyltransferase